MACAVLLQNWLHGAAARCVWCCVVLLCCSKVCMVLLHGVQGVRGAAAKLVA